MMSSFRINDVNEMATMLMNSDSNKKRERSMMTLPVDCRVKELSIGDRASTERRNWITNLGRC